MRDNNLNAAVLRVLLQGVYVVQSGNYWSMAWRALALYVMQRVQRYDAPESPAKPQTVWSQWWQLEDEP